MTCEHEWIEVLNRRWCVRPYDEGGCGAYQYRRHRDAKWITERPSPAVQESLWPQEPK